ncbi:MAG: type IV pilus modification protein PilV [Pseudomonas sp.]
MKTHRGFSLIEVLVTVVLICIGVLGMVAMQGRAIAYTQDSVQRNTAVTLANEMLELMRANRERLVTANNLPQPTSGYYKADGADFPSAPANCIPTPAAAADQIACWAAQASAVLPGASELLNSDFHICRTINAGTCSSVTNGAAIEIQVAWKVKAGECLEDGQDASSTTCHYRLRAEI